MNQPKSKQEVWTIEQYREYLAKKPAINTNTKPKVWINESLEAWCKTHDLILLVELKFSPVRKWRFDWAIPELKIAIEYEGIFSPKSGHTTLGGYMKNLEKYNAATVLGWRILRYSGNKNSYCTLLNDLNAIHPIK